MPKAPAIPSLAALSHARIKTFASAWSYNQIRIIVPFHTVSSSLFTGWGNLPYETFRTLMRWWVWTKIPSYIFGTKTTKITVSISRCWYGVLGAHRWDVTYLQMAHCVAKTGWSLAIKARIIWKICATHCHTHHWLPKLLTRCIHDVGFLFMAPKAALQAFQSWIA